MQFIWNLIFFLTFLRTTRADLEDHRYSADHSLRNAAVNKQPLDSASNSKQLWQQIVWTWRKNLAPSLTWSDTIVLFLLGVHETPGVRDSRGDTTSSGGTYSSSSRNHVGCAGNLSKSFISHNQAVQKIYRSWRLPIWASSVLMFLVY